MNIQSLPWFKFAHDAYLVSEFKAKANAFAKAAYLDLLCYAMKQTPALSLPNDDNVLAGWASLALDAWLQIKELVLSQFSFNQNDNRYYSPMLNELYSEKEQPQANEQQAPRKRAKTNAERQAEYKARKKGNGTGNGTGNENSNESVTASHTTSNEQVTPSNEIVTASNATGNEKTLLLGGKGGDLDLEQDLNKDLVVVNQTVANNQNAHDIAKPATLQQTTKFFMSFDFNIEPIELEPFLTKLQVPMTKHTSQAFGSFVSYYVTKSYQNTREQWVYQYAKWLEREKQQPADNSPTTHAKPASEFILPVKPLWETLAERKAERESSAPKTETQAAALALAQIKKTVGLKAA